jgi:hypothetical protein
LILIISGKFVSKGLSPVFGAAANLGSQKFQNKREVGRDVIQ